MTNRFCHAHTCTLVMPNRYAKRIDELRATHRAELRKKKEAMQAAEKIRRDTWIKEHTKKIKDMTVKGLEPEVSALVISTKHSHVFSQHAFVVLALLCLWYSNKILNPMSAYQCGCMAAFGTDPATHCRAQGRNCTPT